VRLLILLVPLSLSLISGHPRPTVAEHVHVTEAKRPALPVVDINACPFEGCRFGKWTVIRTSALYTTWKANRRAIGTLEKGQVVTGMTGVHVTRRPDVIYVFRAIPELGLKAGDVVLRYMYLGEGYANIWANGRYIKSADLTFVTEKSGFGCLRDCQAAVEENGEKEWWVEVKTSSGEVGWTKADYNFDGVDALASE
jgi:hypothetical protein